MKNLFPVQKNSYQKRGFESLAAFAANVAQRMSSDPAYQAYLTAANELKDLAGQFKTAIDEARDRSVSHVIVKKQLREKTMEALNKIVDTLKLSYTGDPLWVLNAGFEIAAKETKPLPENLEPPFNLKVTSTGLEGQLKLKFRILASRMVKTNAVEYSIDNGSTWKNGMYCSSNGITITNLPKKQEVQIRVRSLGTGTKMSAWSEVETSYIY